MGLISAGFNAVFRNANMTCQCPLYQCDKCGWKPEAPAKPSKFCPECGERFDEMDDVK